MEGRLMSSDNPPADLLTVQIEHRTEVFTLEVRFSVTQPWSVLFGPSGSGKTTILRAMAGFLRPNRGRIAAPAQTLFDSTTKIFVPAYQRPIRIAGQGERLFPHLTVRWNLVYGNGWTSKPEDAMDIAEELLESFGLRGFADRMPDKLSGGEQQRALVARALLGAITFNGPQKPLLLLDEPFSGLDNATRDELVSSLRSWLTKWKIPVLSVTHDLGEAFQLGAEVIKIADGRIVQQGPVGAVLVGERERLLEQLNVVKKTPA